MNGKKMRLLVGFTLIELLVVLAIVASLLTIVAPRYFDQTDKAAETVLRENLYSLRRAIDLYRGDKGRYPDSLQVLVDEKYLREIPVDPVVGTNRGWQVIRDAAAAPAGVVDVRSGALGVGRDGSAYASW